MATATTTKTKSTSAKTSATKTSTASTAKLEKQVATLEEKVAQLEGEVVRLQDTATQTVAAPAPAPTSNVDQAYIDDKVQKLCRLLQHACSVRDHQLVDAGLR